MTLASILFAVKTVISFSANHDLTTMRCILRGNRNIKYLVIIVLTLFYMRKSFQRVLKSANPASSSSIKAWGSGASPFD